MSKGGILFMNKINKSMISTLLLCFGAGTLITKQDSCRKSTEGALDIDFTMSNQSNNTNTFIPTQANYVVKK